MLPRYHLDLVRDSADQVIYEESANYGAAFTCLGIGFALIALALAGARLGDVSRSRQRLLATSFSGGLLLCCLSVSYFIKSRIVLDRGQQTLSIRRSLLGIPWTNRYRIGDIETIYEGAGQDPKKKSLGIELTSGRWKKLLFWAESPSLAPEEAHLNEVLKRFRRFAEKQTGQVHQPATEDQWWRRTNDNAAADLRMHLRRTLYCFLAGGMTAGVVVMLLSGHPLHRYWRVAGPITYFTSLICWIAFILEAYSSYIDWTYVRDLRRIDKTTA